jgi:anti-sigma B factor antagonist
VAASNTIPASVKPFAIQIEEASGTARVVLQGELDIATSPKAEAELRRIEGGGVRLVVLDLRGLTFMDSTGLRLLVGADARARESGHRLAIVRGPDAVHRVLEITGLDTRLDVVADPAELN